MDLAKEVVLKTAILGFEMIIKRCLKRFGSAKVNIRIASVFNKASNPEELMDGYACFIAPYPAECYRATNIREDVTTYLYLEIMKKVDMFETKHSGWNLLAIDFIELLVDRWTPLRVGLDRTDYSDDHDK